MTCSMICWLHEVDERHVGRVGGKGANLGRLLRLGLPVPPGFVVTTQAYRAVVASTDLAAAGLEQLRARLPSTPLPDQVRQPASTSSRPAGRNDYLTVQG
jgi:rifampicin phosphotransferase